MKELMKFTPQKLLFFIGGLFIIIASYFYLQYSWNAGITERSKIASIIAKSAADGLDGIMLRQLGGLPEDANTTAYVSIKSRLQKLITIDPSIRFAYFYTIKDGKIYFMVDSEPVGSADESPAGQLYKEASQEYYLPFQYAETIITKETTDHWGTWYSILVPIKNNEGKVTSVLAIDYPAAVWFDLAKTNLKQATILLFFSYIVITLFFLTIRSKNKIKFNLNQQQILADISIELNKYAGEKNLISDVLKKIGLHISVDRIYIFEDDLEKQTTSNTFEWCAKGIKPEINNLQDIPYDNKLSDFVSSLDNQGGFTSEDTNLLSKGLKDILLPQGIKSIVIVPLVVDGKKIGFIGFDQVSRFRKWGKETINLLKIVSTAISSALEKERHIEEAKREKDKILTIVQGIGDAVFVVDQEKNLIIFNGKAEELSGFSKDEALGKPYKKILHFVLEKDGSVNDTFVNQAFATGKTQEMTNHTQLVRKDGSKIAVADSAAPLKDKTGAVIGCVVVFRDISREREIDKMKSDFISVASHQLKTPLAGIKWMSQILLDGKDTKPSKKQKEYLLDIYRSNERMIGLVNDLLDVSHIENGSRSDIKKQKTDIVTIVEEILQENKQLILAKKLNIIRCKNTPNKLLLNIDGGKIKQAYNNIINNAIKYSKDGGQIDIGCEHKKNSTLFFIKDNGVGIPRNQQAKIFNKFFRASNVSVQETDGTGLGLYIAKSIIEAHEGKIWFESTENVGTTFFFELPI